MRNIKLILQYDGTDYHGWQSQARGERTVQRTLQECVERLTGKAASLTVAGRTDAGVHALGQVACFRTSSGLETATVKRALNALLPPDIRVSSAEEVEASFHPGHNATGKRYFYLISVMDRLSPFLRRYVWHLPSVLRTDDMEAAGSRLLGRHDFRAFMGAGSDVRETMRELTHLSVREEDGPGFPVAGPEGGLVRITLEGTGFLRYMVRNIVGTLVEVARGRMSPGSLREVIESGDRRAAGPTAPARGLFLERVYYR